MPPQNPFYRSESPKNGYELFKWFIFEPNRLRKFEKSLSWIESGIWFFKTYIWVIILSIFLYLLFSAIIVWSDLPIRFPKEFEPEIIKQWTEYTLTNYLLWLNITYKGLAFGLAGGLAGGLAYGLAGGLAFGVSFCISWYLSYFRLIFYPFYLFRALFTITLTKNPYLNDAVIAFLFHLWKIYFKYNPDIICIHISFRRICHVNSGKNYQRFGNCERS